MELMPGTVEAANAFAEAIENTHAPVNFDPVLSARPSLSPFQVPRLWSSPG